MRRPDDLRDRVRAHLVLLVALFVILGTPAVAAAAPAVASLAPLAADSPFGSKDDAQDDTADGGPAGRRLARTAIALRRSPLFVDPEMDWMLDAKTRRSLLRTLEGARIKVFVAALPVIDEDESGGDFDRIIRALQQGVGQDGLYVVVDQDGRMDLASVGVPLDLRIAFSLLFPDRDERPYDEQARDPAPPPWTSVPERLREMVATVEKAEPGEPNDLAEARGELPPVYVDYRAERLREDAIFGLVAGVLLGLTAAGSLLGILHLVRRSRGGGGGGRPPRSGPRPSSRQGRGSRRRRRSRRA